MAATGKDKLTMIELKFDEEVAILKFKHGKQNQLTYAFLEEIHECLDAVLRNEDIKLLVTTSEGKFYSNGIDLSAMADPEPGRGAEDFLDQLNALCARIMTFPMPTIAAINGHAIAGGMLLAMSHDYRVQNKERGWITMNEVFIPHRLTPFITELLKQKLPHGIAQLEVIALGRRFTGDEAFQRGIVQASVPPSELMMTTVEMGKNLFKGGEYFRIAVHSFKIDIYRSLLDMLGKHENALALPDDYRQFPKSKI